MAENRIHRNPDTLWLFDYNSLLVMDDCPRYIVSLSERDINIIWQSVLNIGRFRSRVFTNAQGIIYTIVTPDEFSIFQEWVSDMNVNMGDFMTCTTALDLIAEALQALVDKPCCPSGSTAGSRGSGSSDNPPNPYNQTETPTEPPPGFSDMEVFDSHKCNQAQDILDQLQSDLVGLSGLTYSASTPTGIVGALIVFFLTPIPFDDLIALAAYLIYSAFSYTFLAEMASVIEDNEDDLRCALYDSPSSSDARSSLLGELETLALAHFTSSADAEWVLGAVDYMLSYDSLNRLFQNTPTSSSGADCSACSSNNFTDYTCLFMAVGGEDESPVFLEQDAEDTGSNYVWAIGWATADERTFTLVSGTLTPSPDWTGGLEEIDYTDNNCGAGNNGSWDEVYGTFAVSVVNGPNKTVQFFSSTPFRMRVTITG